jgi:hypothetical protein
MGAFKATHTELSNGFVFKVIKYAYRQCDLVYKIDIVHPQKSIFRNSILHYI